MKKKFNINIDRKSFLYLFIYSGIILIIVLVGIFPLLYSYKSHLEENKKLKYQIEEHGKLDPIYATLLKAVKNKNLFALPNPVKTTIPRKESGKFQDDFRTIAGKTGLMTVSFTLDLNTLGGSSTSLLHNVVLRGEFANFKKMLIGLGAIPYLDRIEEISIQQRQDSTEFRMKIWIALK